MQSYFNAGRHHRPYLRFSTGKKLQIMLPNPLANFWQPAPELGKSTWPGIFTSALVAIMLTFVFLLRIKVMTNDDVFTYFNYARNTAEGRFFAIDYRNVAGEGFSSTLYMLLLVPLHLLGVNPMLGGVILNYAALFATLLISAHIFKSIFDFSAVGYSAALGILGSFYLRNTDVIGIAGWAFETLYSPLIFSALLLLTIKTHKETIARPRHLVVVVLFMLGLLVRPENCALFMPAVAFYAFAFWGRWMSVLKLGLMFTIAIATLAIAKWSIFHDFFPTGYYRKFANIDYGVSSGADFIRGWYSEHVVEIRLAFIIVVAIVSLALFSGGFKTKGMARIIFIFCSVICATIIINLAFCRVSTPLVGYHYRYLILCNYLLEFLGTFGVLLLVRVVTKLLPTTTGMKLQPISFVFTLAIPLLMLYNSVHLFGSVAVAKQKLNLIADTDKQVAIHPYLRFGRYLKSHIANHEKLTISMGDGGAVPYAAQCNTIDPAGLTEPFVAHLATYPNADRWKIYSDYIESYKPDLVVVIMGTIGKAEDTTDVCYLFSHLPVPMKDYVRYLKEMSKKNYTYVSSISSDMAGAGMPYDIHLVVRKDSPMAKRLIKTCQDYSAMRGYTMAGNYTIFCDDVVAVLPKYRK